MKDAHVAWRTSICLIALIVATALPAEAQPRNLQQVDDAVKQQQAFLDQLKPSLEQLKSSVEQLTRENEALRQTLAEINRKPAPPEAWNALRRIGLAFVAAWALVALVRAWASTKISDAEVELKIRKGIDARTTPPAESAKGTKP